MCLNDRNFTTSNGQNHDIDEGRGSTATMSEESPMEAPQRSEGQRDSRFWNRIGTYCQGMFTVGVEL